VAALDSYFPGLVSNKCYSIGIKLHLHCQSFSMIIPATATSDSHYCTVLDQLGSCNTDRIISILLSRVAMANGFAHIFANVDDPLMFSVTLAIHIALLVNGNKIFQTIPQLLFKT
jgi:hypothetical protein